MLTSAVNLNAKVSTRTTIRPDTFGICVTKGALVGYMCVFFKNVEQCLRTIAFQCKHWVSDMHFVPVFAWFCRLVDKCPIDRKFVMRSHCGRSTARHTVGMLA